MRRLLIAAAWFLGLWGPWFAWRWWYYGWPFPNTYYVKASGPWVSPNLAGEMQKMLTTVQFEISTTIRFKPNDGAPGDDKKMPKPEVKADVQMKRTGRVTDRVDPVGPVPGDDRPRERRRNRE